MKDKEVKYAELRMPLNGGDFLVFIPDMDLLTVENIADIEDIWLVFGKKLARMKKEKIDSEIEMILEEWKKEIEEGI